MKKLYVEPTVEVMSFLSQERLMASAYGKEGFQLFGAPTEDINIGDITPEESGAGGGTGWDDF